MGNDMDEKASLNRPSPQHHAQSPSSSTWLQRLRRNVIMLTLVLIPLYFFRGHQLFSTGPKLHLYHGEDIQWTSCGEITDHALECATLDVPMDHFNASSSGDKTFSVPILRMRGHEAKQGKNLLLNPGGPGNSGVGFLYRVGEALNLMVGEGYHLVSFDPRGVNGSNPGALCYPDGDTRQLRSGKRDKDIVQDSADVYAWAKNYARACEETTSEHGQYVNTPQTAADMNSILDVLGQDKLDYWGLSYGTLLGQTYAMLFPERAGKMIIDGVANVFQYYTSEPKLEMMTDTVNTLEGFYDECFKAGEICALTRVAKDKKELKDKIESLSEQLKRQPMSVYINSTHYGTIDYTTLWHDAFFRTVYTPITWYGVAERLAKLLEGHPEDFFLRFGLQSSGMMGVDAFDFIMNNDGLTGPEHWPQDREALLERIMPNLTSSRFAPTLNERFYIKQQWRFPRHNFYPKGPVKLSTPLLILTQNYDPVTPAVSALSAKEAFPGSKIVKMNGYGHCSIAHPSSCYVGYVRKFLYQGELPAEDVTCEVDGPFIFNPENPGDESVPEDIRGDEDKLRLFEAQRYFYMKMAGA